MKPRKVLAATTFVSLLVAGYAFDLEALGTIVLLAYCLAIAVALFATFYDQRNFPKKTWDFNPKRGLLFFGIGLIAFPILIAARAFGETELEWGNVALFTIIGSTMAGIAGTFTENIGI